MQLQFQQTSGTAGGSSSAGAWTTYPLNTEVIDTGNHNTLTSNHFVLDAGTYDLQASAAMYLGAQGKLRLRNTTDGATVLVGMSNYSSTASGSTGALELSGRFTIAASKNLELQYWSNGGQATNGLGVATSSGEVEVYADVQLFKVG